MAQRDAKKRVDRGPGAAELLAAIVDTSDDAIVSTALDGTVRTWNAGAERLFGYSAKEAVGRPITFVFPAARIEEERKISERLKAGERIEHLETMRMRSDGQPIHVSVTVSPIRDESGAVVGASQIVRDETERRAAHRALRESEALFRTLVEQVEDYAIFGADTAGRATTWNEGVRRVLGFEEKEFLGRDIVKLIFTPDDVEAGVPQRELEIAARVGTASNDRWMQRKDGGRFFAAGVTTALRDEAVHQPARPLRNAHGRHRPSPHERQPRRGDEHHEAEPHPRQPPPPPPGPGEKSCHCQPETHYIAPPRGGGADVGGGHQQQQDHR